MKNNNSLKWLWTVSGKKKLYIVVLMAAQAASGLLSVVFALVLKSIIDRAVDKDVIGFRNNFINLLILVIIQLALRAFMRWIGELARTGFENCFKERLYKNILVKDYATVSAIHSGEWINRLTNDTVVVSNGCVGILPGLSGMVIKMIGALAVLIYLEKRFAMILIPGGLVLLAITYAFRGIMKKLHKGVQEKDGLLRIFLHENIGSMMIVRSFAVEEQSVIQANSKMKDHRAARMRRNRFSNFCNTGFGAAMNAMYLFGIGFCGYGIITGSISYGTLTAILQLIGQVQAPFANITGYIPMYYSMIASAERLIEIESFDGYEGERVLGIDEIRTYYADNMASFGLDNAGFTYYPIVENIKDLTKDNMPEVIGNLSLTINKGEYVALTGHSGCGKSTLLKLLMCIYELDGGERFICDRNGAKEILSPKWHRLFAYVPQGNQLMSNTVREVVSFADPDQANDDTRIQNALKVACADEFVNKLENGVDTLLGERGTGLSEGQMQRIAIARAVFSDCPVILLDEATSALDEQTEKSLLENLRSMTDRTVIIVTHRPAALEICDRVIKFTEEGITG